MRRFDDDCEAMDRFPLHPWVLRGMRIVLLGILVAIPVVPAAFFLMPMPRGADGITLCLPGLGPLQQFAEGLDADLEEVVHIHERVHATQCRRLGAFAYARAYLADEGMLDLEAEAYCAEAHTLVVRGRDPGPWISRIVETLYWDYPHTGQMTIDEIEGIVRRWCPPPGARTATARHP